MENTKRLKIGAFQFAACENIESNLAAIERGIAKAAAENVRLLLTQECASCGYPPVEVAATDAIDPAWRHRSLTLPHDPSQFPKCIGLAPGEHEQLVDLRISRDDLSCQQRLYFPGYLGR